MYFFDYDFLQDANTALPYCHTDPVKTISIQNGVFDDFYLTSDSAEFDSTDKEWNINTIIHSDFNSQNLLGGNLPYLTEELYSIRLKRRELGQLDWITLYEKVIDHTAVNVIEAENEEGEIQDIVNFEYHDKYARGRNTKYQYCVVPVLIDGIEQSYTAITVESDFDGAMISDSIDGYHIMLEPRVTSTTQNKNVSVITTLSNKYPYIFSGSDSNYESGSFSGVVIMQNDNYEFEVESSTRFRKEFVEWLTNNHAKILKIYDGRIWMIHVSGTPQIDCSEHYDKVTISFEWVEIGDSESQSDLYINEFIDYSGGSI